MFKSHPLATHFIVFIVLPAIVVAVFAARMLYSSLPQTQGDLAVAGLKAQVTVARDEYGVPHVEATQDSDAYFALGFVHAQDRMWQLELQRRMAQGRLSEILGRDAVRQDIWFRTLGLGEAAASSWQVLPPRSRNALSAYAAGINAWLATRQRLPVEFTVYGIEPQPWRVEDSLAWMKFFSLDLSGNLNAEIERYLTAQYLSPDYRDFLHAGYPKDAPVTVPGNAANKALSALLDLRKEAELRFQVGGAFVGSNAWVVSGDHTKSGNPIVANDPHLGLQMPSLWYAVSLKSPDLSVSGMSLVGLPLIVFGQNGDIAWAGTNMMADTQDLYVEQLNPSNPQQYKVGDTWNDFEVRTESIQVRADFPAFLRKPLKPVVVQIRKSRHGPVVSDVVGVLDQPIALRWMALEPDDTTFDAFLGLHYAKNWEDFQSAMAQQITPPLNMLYADRNKNIGYLGVGRIPIRKKGQGTVPVPGWTDEYEWASAIPFESMPRSFNPDTGYLVSANNRVVGDEYPYFISDDWAPPSRAQRIEGLLLSQFADGRKLDNETMQSMQADIVSLPAARLLPYLTAVRPLNAGQEVAIAKLSEWRGQMSVDSAAAAIFNVWMRHLRTALFADEVARFWNKPQQMSYMDSVVGKTSLDQVREALEDKAPHWCDDVDTQVRESCSDILQKSLGAALAELTKLKGADPEDWKWGGVQQTDYAHVPFGEVKTLLSVFSRRVPNGGSLDTINVAGSFFRDSVGYLQNFGPGFRQVMEIGGDRTIHTYMNSTGQSGHILSPYYDNMVLPFRDGEFHSMGEDALQRNAEVLKLRPAT